MLLLLLLLLLSSLLLLVLLVFLFMSFLVLVVITRIVGQRPGLFEGTVYSSTDSMACVLDSRGPKRETDVDIRT